MNDIGWQRRWRELQTTHKHDLYDPYLYVFQIHFTAAGQPYDYHTWAAVRLLRCQWSNLDENGQIHCTTPLNMANTVTSWWARWRLKSPASPLFTQAFRKHQSSASLAFVWGIHRWPVNTPHKSQQRGKCFQLMTSSWHNRNKSNDNKNRYILCDILSKERRRWSMSTHNYIYTAAIVMHKCNATQPWLFYTTCIQKY